MALQGPPQLLYRPSPRQRVGPPGPVRGRRSEFAVIAHGAPSGCPVPVDAHGATCKGPIRRRSDGSTTLDVVWARPCSRFPRGAPYRCPLRWTVWCRGFMTIRLETLGGVKVVKDGAELVHLPRQRLRCALL